MSNPHRGEVSFEAGGKTHIMQFNTDAICNLEAQFDLGIGEIHQRIVGMRISAARAAFRAGLRGGATVPEVNAIIDELGFAAALKVVIDALNLAFPSPSEDGGGPPPTGEGAGTGAVSS